MSSGEPSVAARIFGYVFFGMCILSCLCCIFGIPIGVYLDNKDHKKRKARSKKIGPITKTSMVPIWLPKQEGQKSQPFIKFQTRPIKSPREEPFKNHVKWAQDHVNKRFINVTLPDDTCSVSVPMKNFKCGKHPGQFEPVSEVIGTFTYQMFGDSQIQVTTYHEDGISYIAGYCIFIWSPYSSEIFDSSVITTCMNSTKYPAPEQGTLVLRANELELRPWNLQQVSKSFKMYHCSSANKPLMIGMDSGEMKHFEWKEANEIYEITDCASCRVENYEDQDSFPPSYSTLSVCEC